DVVRLAGEDMPAVLPPSTTMTWAYTIKAVGLGDAQVTGLADVYERIRKSRITVDLGTGKSLKQTQRTYGEMISLGEVGHPFTHELSTLRRTIASALHIRRHL